MNDSLEVGVLGLFGVWIFVFGVWRKAFSFWSFVFHPVLLS